VREAAARRWETRFLLHQFQQQQESSFTNAQFTPPLRTFFTVDNGYDLTKLGNATIAAWRRRRVYGRRIPGWKNSLLVLSLVRGAVYRLPLAPGRPFRQGTDQRVIQVSEPLSRHRAQSRRAHHLHRDGSIRAESRPSGAVSQKLANPGSILELKYAP
jgi:hypothetical protein